LRRDGLREATAAFIPADPIAQPSRTPTINVDKIYRKLGKTSQEQKSVRTKRESWTGNEGGRKRLANKAKKAVEPKVLRDRLGRIRTNAAQLASQHRKSSFSDLRERKLVETHDGI
jgi:hypothetical protein